MKIGVIGAGGFIGSAIYNFLKKEYNQVYAINRDSYEHYRNTRYDVLINANGNSRKFWANNNPKEDFKLSVQSVYNVLYDFEFDKYIQISSIDACGTGIYGKNKRTVEQILKSNLVFNKLAIIRCPLVVGKGMKKGIVFDILNGNPVYSTLDSTYSIVSTAIITEIVAYFVKDNIWSDFDLGSTNFITVEDIGKVLGKNVKTDFNARKEMYDMYPISPQLKKFSKSAEEILKELI